MPKLWAKKPSNAPGRCFTYVPMTHAGTGWVQTCVSLLENFPGDVLTPTLILPITWKAISRAVDVRQAIPLPLRFVPYRYVSPIEQRAVAYCFRRCVAAVSQRDSLAYFWPAPPTSLVRYTRAYGLLTVREMINTPL